MFIVADGLFQERHKMLFQEHSADFQGFKWLLVLAKLKHDWDILQTVLNSLQPHPTKLIEYIEDIESEMMS